MAVFSSTQKHRRVLWRIQIQADDVRRLALEVRIVGSHVALQSMGLEAGFPPDTMHHRLADAECGGEFAAGPVGGTVARLAAGRVEDASAQFRGELRRRLTGPFGFESVESGLEKTSFPFPDRSRGDIELVGDDRVGETRSRQQHDLGPNHEARGQRLRTSDRL